MEFSLTQELDRLRATHQAADVSRGMAIVTLEGEVIGIFTVVFAEAWCKDDPAYKWERL